MLILQSVDRGNGLHHLGISLLVVLVNYSSVEHTLTFGALLLCAQGALIALALVLMQQPESRVAPLRKRIDKVIHDKHEEVGHIMSSMYVSV